MLSVNSAMEDEEIYHLPRSNNNSSSQRHNSGDKTTILSFGLGFQIHRW